jgi:hypothetical protein
MRSHYAKSANFLLFKIHFKLGFSEQSEVKMTTYEEIRSKIKSLTLDEQMQLMEELASIVSHRKIATSERSIMDLEGLGKDIWQGIDAQEYIDQERQSWNG